ncbi:MULTISPECIES: MFS transporter [unclassified Micromonospora]|uniref:MFS transporter n=1 Tax=unclassified Micromonospora TaxID=2617518 RepID=UPI003A8B10A3
MTSIDAAGATRRFVWVSALTSLPAGLHAATMVLLLTSRGIGLSTIGVAMAVQGVVTLTLELPTGGLSDLAGRRQILAAAGVFTTVAMIWLAVADVAWQFLVIGALIGVARALSSGPAEAWYVDTVRAVDPRADVKKGLARGHTAGFVALALGMVGGGAAALVVPLPSDGVLVPLSISPLAAAAASIALVFVVVFWLPEPVRPRTGALAILRDVPHQLRTGIRLGVSDPGLSRVLVTTIAVGVALGALELLAPARMATLAGGTAAGSIAYAAVSAVGFGTSAIGASLNPPLHSWLGTAGRVAAVGTAVAATSLLGMAAVGQMSGTAGLLVTAGFFCAMFVGLGIVSPARSVIIHDRVGAGERATALSVTSLTTQGGGVVATFGLGYLAESSSIAVTWWIAGVLMLVSAAVFPEIRSAARMPAATTPVSGLLGEWNR